MEMDERKIRILQAIINDYINTAEPVGSRTIAKKYDLGISSATIRNEMSDLEEMGYLEQLHTSSGRIPSDKGYRLYVDKLMYLPSLSEDEEMLIKNQLFNVALFEVEKLVKQAVIILSELTKLTCIVQTPSVSQSHIMSVQLLNVDNNNVLVVIITDSGMIKNNLIKLRKPINPENIVNLSNILNARLRHLTVNQINLEVINSLKMDLRGYEDIFDAIIPALYDSLTTVGSSEFYFEGTTNIFNYPEYNDIGRARQFLDLINDKEKLKHLLNADDNLNVSIGNENFIEGAKECSIISTTYTVGGKPLGSIGVIGPTRMPYSKVISILSKINKELSDSITKLYSDDE